jgi:hypothetical protein
MAQTGGTLLGETHKFARLVFLAKVPKVTYHDFARPGDQLIYSATLLDAREEGGMLAPWRLVFPLARDDEYVMAEYACHEGNYAVRNILSAARALGGRRP